MSTEHLVSRLELAAQADAVRWARSHTCDALRSWGIGEDHIDTARLAVSELVTNAVRHTTDELTDAPPQRLALTLHREPHRLLVWLADPSNKPPARAVQVSGAEGGRGLLILEQLTKEWSYYFLPTGGKVVWCSISLN
ncbi:ATP-binding protein [Streptomyces sp. A5-4]|uniref:ATP-binding protein n=1 Tax=Streptomyces sp. A5-4 TaxID=3384771 RepID=UPI003DA8B12D